MIQCICFIKPLKGLNCQEDSYFVIVDIISLLERLNASIINLKSVLGEFGLVILFLNT
jgi:hypothetical protein